MPRISEGWQIDIYFRFLEAFPVNPKRYHLPPSCKLSRTSQLVSVLSMQTRISGKCGNSERDEVLPGELGGAIGCTVRDELVRLDGH